MNKSQFEERHEEVGMMENVLLRRIEELTIENERLKGTLEIRGQELIDLKATGKARLAKAESAREQIEEALSRSGDEIRALRNEISHLSRLLLENEAAASVAKERESDLNANLGAAIQALADKDEALTEIVTELEATRTSLEQDLATSHQQLEAQKAAGEEAARALSEQKAELEKSLDGRFKEIAALTMRLLEKDGDSSKTEAAMSAIPQKDETLKALEEELTEYRKKIEEIQRSNKEKINSISEENNILKDSLNGRFKEIAELTKKILQTNT